jgi:hypothetical protein
MFGLTLVSVAKPGNAGTNNTSKEQKRDFILSWDEEEGLGTMLI